MDLLEIKGRIAVALVESIFRRAGFALAPVVHPEVSPRHGREDLIPDFQVTLPTPADGAAEGPQARRGPLSPAGRPVPAHRSRSAGPHSLFTVARRQWPGLLFVFVTDHPEPGRSCFQVVDLESPGPAEATSTSLDLHAHADLRIFRQNVDEHETLLRRMFTLLTGG